VPLFPSDSLGIGLVILFLVIGIWSCLHHGCFTKATWWW